jgi:hypothetical protein
MFFGFTVTVTEVAPVSVVAAAASTTYRDETIMPV